ncbi:MAG: hypothetical protein FWG68_03675 [Defluviitaleaceae bacterium]|nr:hypothetical protein [Defluviitaleaceae bacterium]
MAVEFLAVLLWGTVCCGIFSGVVVRTGVVVRFLAALLQGRRCWGIFSGVVAGAALLWDF